MPRSPKSQNSEVVTVEGRRLTLSNLDKVLYPATGTTKRDVIHYYATVGAVLIPHAKNRPATRKRWVHGVGTPEEPGEMFFQKNLDDSTPEWVKRYEIVHKDHRNEYPLVNDLPTLVWLAQIASLEIHVPQWQFGRTGVPRNPDRLVLDLDPGPGVGLQECAEVARYVRAILNGMGLTAMPVTSGSKGIHLYAALDGSQTSDQISAVAHELARALEADHPDLIVSDMKKSLRDGKVLVDWSQNNGAKTTVVPYSLRGRFEPTVAAPRTWRELASPTLRQLNYTEVLKRVATRGDLLGELTAGHLESLEPTAERLQTFTSTGDRLEKYRSMRSADKTPEPVPDKPSGSSDGQTFVIQEHHATRLHYDFRLEHDGVLVSWALPKGVPTEPKQNHLAVQTEDHPLEYGGFEGTIPEGQYGAGTVSIWDAGTYDLEKWRDGEEVIVTLHGKKGGGLGGDRTVALIHTGSARSESSKKAEQNWLIHLMKEQHARTSDAPPAHGVRAKPARTAASRDETTVAPSAMLATLGTASDITDEPDWAFEMKWDGIRAIVTKADGRVTLTSRNSHDLTRTYPELATSLADSIAAEHAILDGEIVALNRAGRPDFGLLQGRMNLTKSAEIERAAAAVPVHIMLFDILSVDGQSLMSRSYDDRRTALEANVHSSDRGAVQVPPAFSGDLAHAIETSKQLKLEGVVAKRRDAHYQPGRRSRSWIKIKHHATQEVIVVGWRGGNGRRAEGIGSLLLGIPEDDQIRYVGRVGTGFTDRMLDDILRRLRSRERLTSPAIAVPSADARDAHWVRTDLVGEVEFAEWTADRRLRQPVWRGWRPDKSPDDVTIESPA